MKTIKLCDHSEYSFSRGTSSDSLKTVHEGINDHPCNLCEKSLSVGGALKKSPCKSQKNMLKELM